MSEDGDNSVLVGMQIQLGEIKGILNTIVTEHARRIGDAESNHRQLRFDLEAVKSEAAKATSALADKLNNMATKGQEEGGKILRELNTDLVTNKNKLAELESDMKEVKEKANASWGKVLGVLAIVASFGSFLWQVLGK